VTAVVVAVGLGPAGPELLTAAARAAIEEIPRRYLRTARHPSAVAVPDATSFDDLYDRAETFPEVYGAIVDALAAAAAEHGRVLYAVPGSPRVAEATVAALQEDPRVELEVVPGLSFLDLVWDRLGVDPVTAGARLVDGGAFAVDAAGERGPLVVGQCWSRQVLSDIKLAVTDEAPESAVILHHLGLPDEVVRSVAWEDIDRSVEADHLTTLWVPRLAAPVGVEMLRLAELVRALRQRCPWDRAQTHQSLTRHLLEESYEVLEAIEALERPDGSTDPDAFSHLEEELGDLLFQVYFHATLASEEGHFDLSDVARGIHDKLVVRHPHVFGDVKVDTPDQVMSNWERIKRDEKGRSSLMDGIPAHLPALHYANKVQRKAASVGFDWPSVDGPLAKVAEEADEVRAEITAGGDAAGPAATASARLTHEVGDLLFAVVNVARHVGVDPEAALRASTSVFRSRFAEVERLAAERGIDVHGAGIEVLDGLWDEAKEAEGAVAPREEKKADNRQ